MIQAKEFIVVEFDAAAIFLKKCSLEEFNERRKQEFKNGYYDKNMLLIGVYEDMKSADDCIEYYKDRKDELLKTILNSENPFIE